MYSWTRVAGEHTPVYILYMPDVVSCGDLARILLAKDDSGESWRNLLATPCRRVRDNFVVNEKRTINCSAYCVREKTMCKRYVLVCKKNGIKAL